MGGLKVRIVQPGLDGYEYTGERRTVRVGDYWNNGAGYVYTAVSESESGDNVMGSRRIMRPVGLPEYASVYPRDLVVDGEYQRPPRAKNYDTFDTPVIKTDHPRPSYDV